MAILISVAGTTRTRALRVDAMAIREYAGGQPNTCTCRVWNFTPVQGQDIKIGLGSLAAANLIFAGLIVKVVTRYEGDKPTQLAYDLFCQGYDAPQLLNRRKVTKKYTAVSGSTIAAALITDNVQGFPAPTSVEASLASVAEITFTNDDVTAALDQLAKRLGAVWWVDYAQDLHFFVTSTLGGSATAITDAAPGGARDLSYEVDLARVVTRVLVEGQGSSVAADIAVGQTSIPVTDATPFNASGGTAVVGPQRVTYTSRVVLGGQASTTTGITQSISAPSRNIIDTVGGNLRRIGAGYRHRVTFVINGGESNGGTVTSQGQMNAVSASGSAPSVSQTTGGSLVVGNAYAYGVTFVTSAGETTLSGTNSVTISGSNNAVSVSSIPTSGDARVIARRLYRDTNASGTFKLIAQFNDNTTTTYTDVSPSHTSAAPSSNTAGEGTFQLVSIPTGGTGTTARRIYRTKDGGSDYYLVGEIQDNSTTSFVDNVSDAGLGSTQPPTTSETGVPAANTSLPVLDLAQFNSAGGWVVVQGQQIRYTGRSASSGAGTLTGVPSSGAGTIAAIVRNGSNVVALDSLEGVPSSSTGSVLYAINKGDPLALLVTRNDTTAQTALATLTGYDGIVEEYARDNRLSETEAAAFGDARLAVLKDPLVTVRYETRDTAAKPGRTVAINIASPPINATFRIQAVTVSGDAALAAGTGNPLRRVEASSQRLSFEQVLALIRYDRRL